MDEGRELTEEQRRTGRLITGRNFKGAKQLKMIQKSSSTPFLHFVPYNRYFVQLIVRKDIEFHKATPGSHEEKHFRLSGPNLDAFFTPSVQGGLRIEPNLER